MKENKKTAAIVSLYGNSNFGNKLQNYAVQEILKKEGLNTVNIVNISPPGPRREPAGVCQNIVPGCTSSPPPEGRVAGAQLPYGTAGGGDRTEGQALK